ncbi:hypothetical protein [Pseudomonas sp. St316]|uniref:hypothetical protein n=1 Tax=Pseudomonas sp. St316 TaxID=2678257 RepID=UPI001BB34FED|nr:hypothetical protein [Pseudomonas sp. St316]BBP59834.1 hypothetical protein PHLH4_34240 [Pseudomonas sp. St316]
MLDIKKFDFICSVTDKLDSSVIDRIKPEIKAALGAPASVMFKDFAAAFPLTANAIDEQWLPPVAAFKKGVRLWLPSLVCQGYEKNLFFNLTSVNEPTSGQQYDLEHAMLPLKWRELYRLFDSFVVTESSVQPTGWLNAPFDFASRMTLERYRIHVGGKKAAMRALEEKIGSLQLRCWLLTESGDALFLDEARCDHKVYHMKNGEFDDCHLLKQADEVLDKYLAGYVSENVLADFNFRSGEVVSVGER